MTNHLIHPPSFKLASPGNQNKIALTVNGFSSRCWLCFCFSKNTTNFSFPRALATCYEANRLLGTPPPPISPSESRLTRMQRTTLAQLRSGHCRLLGNYKVLTGISNSALCPQCLFRRQTVPHIFNCDAAQTDLTLRDLWINPVKVVGFLVSLPTFATLIPRDPHPPRPPPEPPP